MPIKIKPATGAGSVSLEAQNAISSDFTLTLPGVDGTVNTSGAVNQVPAGSVSAPSIFPTGDTNTGIYFPAADTIGFVEGGVESMRLDASGNLGLGVTPSAWRSAERAFDVGSYASFINSASAGGAGVVSNAYKNASSVWIYRNTYTASLYEQNTLGDHRWFTAPSGTAGNAISFTQAMTLDSSGRLLVGTTSSVSSGLFILGGDSGSSRILPRTDNVGYVGDSGQRWQAIYAVNGTIQTSDANEKNTIEDSNLGLAFINDLRSVSYKWNVGENIVSYDEDGNEIVTPRPGIRTHYGLIAQEVKAAIPEGVDFGGFVQEPSDGVMSLRYHEFISPMIKAIQELSAKLDAAEARIAALEAK